MCVGGCGEAPPCFSAASNPDWRPLARLSSSAASNPPRSLSSTEILNLGLASGYDAMAMPEGCHTQAPASVSMHTPSYARNAPPRSAANIPMSIQGSSAAVQALHQPSTAVSSAPYLPSGWSLPLPDVPGQASPQAATWPLSSAMSSPNFAPPQPPQQQVQARGISQATWSPFEEQLPKAGFEELCNCRTELMSRLAHVGAEMQSLQFVARNTLDQLQKTILQVRVCAMPPPPAPLSLHCTALRPFGMMPAADMLCRCVSACP